jgi:tetratricopeptide (TPR) repeat protein
MPGPGQTPDGYQDVVERIRKSLKASDLAGAEDLLADIANRRDERLAEYFNLLGVLYEAQGNWRMARKCYSKGMAANRSYAPAEANMRRFYELYTFGETKQTVALGDEPEYEVKARIDDLMRHQRSQR